MSLRIETLWLARAVTGAYHRAGNGCCPTGSRSGVRFGVAGLGESGGAMCCHAAGRERL